MTSVLAMHRRTLMAGDPRQPQHTALGLRPEAATAADLGVKVQTLRKWAVQRKGPPRVKIGKRVFYRPEAIQAWLAAQERDPAAARVS